MSQNIRVCIAFCCLISVVHCAGAQDFEGLWVGLITKGNQAPSEGNTFQLAITKESQRIEAYTREELNGTDFYGIAKGYGEQKDQSLSLKHVVITEKNGSVRVSWCKLEMQLKYDSISGYLKGDYKGLDCRMNGKIVLYRQQKSADVDFSTLKNQATISQKLASDLQKGRNAPEIRAIERKNFVFIPIYFDYDKAFIRPEYFEFLDKMVAIVDSHTDLRIKVIGNTDADGSDAYNQKLSERRAQSIIQYFVSKGLSADRIEIQCNGEKRPVDSNQTDEGKQRNRRVEFEFI